MIGVAPAMVLVVALVLPFGGGASRTTEEGNRHYRAGEFAEALRFYTEAQIQAPQAAELYYNLGNVFYRQQDHQRAAEAYTRALLTASEELEAAASFNLGNAMYRLGQYDVAVEAFERALRLDPGDPDAKRNLELALRARDREQPEGSDPNEGGQAEGGESEAAGSGDSEPVPSPQPAPAPGQMTREEAARMLDGLEEQELENLRREAQQRQARRTGSTEKDW
jgi:tetratricopeptide (TPR) repeat protein